MNKEMQYQVECLASDLTEMLMAEYGWEMLKALDVLLWLGDFRQTQ